MTTKTLASSLAALAASSMLAVQGAVEPVWPDKPDGDLTTVNAVGFENFTAGFTPAAGFTDDGQADLTASYFYYVGTSGDDQSIVTNHAVGTTFPASVPDYFSGLENNLYLSLSTEGGTLFRSLNAISVSGGETNAGTAVSFQSENLYVDTLVQFTPCEDAPTFSDGDGNKLAIWLNVFTNELGEAASTNLCVRAMYLDYENSTWDLSAKTYTLVTEQDVEAGKWYRLTVRAIGDVDKGGESYPAFQIRLDGTVLAATESAASASALEEITNYTDLFTAKTIFPSLLSTATLSAVGFQGTGAVDDFVATTANPFVETIDFTIFWDANVTAINATLDGDPIDFGEISGSGSTNITAAAGAVVYVHVDGTTYASGYSENWSASADVAVDEDWDTEYDPETGDPYLVLLGREYTFTVDGGELYIYSQGSVPVQPFGGGSGTELDPYLVKNVSHLQELQTKVAGGDDFAGVYFKLDEDINLSSTVWTPIGSKTAPFSGVFDGDGKTISNLVLAKGTYAGLFGWVVNGTVKNMTVDGVSFDPNDVTTEEWGGCAFVGTASNAVLQCLLATDSSVSPVAFSGNHNMAGISVKAVFSIYENCTNELDLTTSHTKVGGIVAFLQPAGVVFKNCVNYGDLEGTGVNYTTKDGPGKVQPTGNGLGGIFGWTQNSGVGVTNCANYGAITVPAETTNYKVGSLVGSMNGHPLNAEGCSAQAGMVPVVLNSTASATDLMFATVADGRATFVAADALVKDTEYKVMLDVPVGTTMFTLQAANDYIAFDQSLKEFTGTVAVSDPTTMYAASSESGDVITFTATAKTDASDAVIALSSTSAEWGLGLTFPTVSLTLGGDTIDPADYTTEWSPSSIAAMEEGDPDAIYTVTATITGDKYITGTSKQATFTVTAPAAAVVVPGTPTELDASTAEAATNEAASIKIVVADAEADAEGQATVLKKVIGYNESTGKYFVTAEIDEEKIVNPDTTIADVATNLAAVASAAGLRSVNIPRASVTPGLYYSIAMVDDLSTADTAAWTAGEGTRVLAKDADEVVNLPISKPASGTKAFYKIMINMTQKPAPDPEP